MTKISKPEAEVPEKEPIIRLMRSSEAELLLDLLRRCYQDSYFDSLYYDTKALADVIENCQQYSMVAVTSEGEFVAHIALRNFKNSLTADTSMAIVDPRYRSNGLFVKMGAEMMPVYDQLELCGLYLQAVTVHPHSQSSSLKGHAGVTGVYLNYIPANTEFLAMEAAVRNDMENSEATPVVIMVQPLGLMPVRSIVWPSYYRPQIESAFKQCNMQRDTMSGQKPAKQTLIRIDKKPRQKIINLWLDDIGDDWPSKFKAALKNLDADLESGDYSVIYLQLPLNKYLLDGLIEAAKAQGFFYAGLLPEYGKQDWLGMQKLDRSRVDANNFYLVGDQSKQIFEFIMQD